MKVAVMVDSGSGITQAEAKEMGLFVVPMPFMIDGEEFEEGITLTREEFFRRMGENADISTSQPSPDTVRTAWERVLQEYDQLVYIPMSSGLSGSCQTARMLAEDYDGRVTVVNNQRISVTQRQSALDAKALIAEGMDAEAVKEVLEKEKMESSIYITVDTLKYLKKGGRITPAAAALGTLLRIKPVLQIQGEKLDAFSKARTMKQAKATMMAAMAHDLENRFHDPEAKQMWIEVAHTENEQMAKEFAEELQAQYPETPKIYVAPLALNIACHIGPGSLAVACSRFVRAGKP